MNPQEKYLNDRTDLLAKAEAFLAEGKNEEAQSAMNQITKLDADFEQFKLNNANLNALKENQQVADLTTQSQAVSSATVVDGVNQNATLTDEQVYENAWAKEMMGLGLEAKEASVFENTNKAFKNAVQTTNPHAVVIPETVTQNIWTEAKALYPIIADTNMTFVPGDFTILKETNSGDDAAWYDEDTEVVDGEFALGELNLTGCELAKSVSISWKLRKMSIKAFIPYITNLLAEKMGAALAKGIASGKGKPGAGETFKPEPRGIITAIMSESGKPQVVTYGSSDALSYDKLAKAMSKIKSTYKTGAAIYATSTTIWDQLATLKDENGRPLFVPDVTSGGVGRIFGLVVKEEDSVADGSILFGNVKRGYVANVNENMSIYTEDHVKKRYTDYMEYAIIDGDVLTTKAFALIAPTA